MGEILEPMSIEKLRAAWDDNEDEAGNLKPDPYPQYRILQKFNCGCTVLDSYEDSQTVGAGGCQSYGDACDYESDRAPVSERVVEGVPQIISYVRYHFPVVSDDEREGM